MVICLFAFCDRGMNPPAEVRRPSGAVTRPVPVTLESPTGRRHIARGEAPGNRNYIRIKPRRGDGGNDHEPLHRQLPHRKMKSHTAASRIMEDKSPACNPSPPWCLGFFCSPHETDRLGGSAKRRLTKNMKSGKIRKMAKFATQ